jgi:fucose permease
VVFAVAFVVLGLPDFAHGVAWPEMRAAFDRPLADLGTFLGAQAVGYLAVALTTGRLAGRWELEGLVVRATITSAVGLAVIAAGGAWPTILAGGLLTGAGAGGMDSGLNAAVALRNDGRLMGLLHAGYGVGAAIGPVVVGASLALGLGWRPPYALFALANALLLPGLLGRSLGEAPRHEAMGSPRGVVLACLVFFLYVTLEVTVGQWAFTYLTEVAGLGDFVASLWVGLYWVGLTAGRFWMGLGGHRHAPGRLLTASVSGAAGGALVLWLGGPLAPLGLPLVGLALSVDFPILMLLTPERVGRERAAAGVGWQAAASAAGAAAGPAVTGLVLAARGPAAYGPVAFLLVVVFGAALAVLRRPLRRPGGAARPGPTWPARTGGPLPPP